jgi:hypothetical protein
MYGVARNVCGSPTDRARRETFAGETFVFRVLCCNNDGEDGRIFSNLCLFLLSLSRSSSTSPLKSAKKQKQGCVVRGTTLIIREEICFTALQVP